MTAKRASDVPLRVDPFAVSLLDNEELRPWTINRDADERLKLEMSALENTLTLTSPQKNAGKRGVSVLDIKFPELVQFEATVHQRARANGYRTKYDPVRGVFPPNSRNAQSKGTASTSSSKPSRLSERESCDEPYETTATSQRADTRITFSTPQATTLVDVDDPDVQYIEKIQKKIFEDSRRMRESPMRPGTVPSPIRYRSSPQPALLTAKMSATYLKMRQSMQKDSSSGSFSPTSPKRWNQEK